MASFDAAIEAQLSGATVKAAPLAEFHFVSGIKRYWPGFGSLTADGKVWDGTAGIGEISGLSAGYGGGAAGEVTFRLTGTDAILANIAADAAESLRRDVYVYVQFFQVDEEDENGAWVEWQPLGDPLVVFWGILGPLKPERPLAGSVEDPGLTRVIEISAIDALANRRRPAFAFYTDRDQKARYPTDEIFANIPQFVEAIVHWPAP